MQVTGVAQAEMSQDAFNEQVAEALKNIAGGLKAIDERLDAFEKPDILSYIGALELAHHTHGNVQGVVNDLGVADCKYIRSWLQLNRDYFNEIITLWGLKPTGSFWDTEVLPLLEKRIEQEHKAPDGSSKATLPGSGLARIHGT